MKFLPLCICLLVLAAVPAYSLYSSSDRVVDLTDANFQSSVIKSDDFWLVEFYAPWCGHCKQLAPEYKKVADLLKGIVKVGAVDMDKYQSLGQPYNVQGFPTIKLFAANKRSPIDYSGARTAQAMADFVISELKNTVQHRSGSKSKSSSGSSKSEGGNKNTGSKVIQLTSSNFDENVLESDDVWMVEFFAPWCGHCKNLAPHWEKAAKELDGIVKVAAVDATVHGDLAQKYGIKGYPTIKVFKSGANSKKSPMDYNGGRTSDDIVTFAKNLAGTAPAKPKNIEQLINSEVLQKECGDVAVCMISFLPHIIDSGAEKRQAYISTLQSVAEKQKGKPYAYVWSEGGSQPQLEQALEIGGSGYPAVAAINMKKLKFASHAGAFSPDSINTFLSGIYNGKERLISLDAIPNVETVEKWDGKDVPRESSASLSVDDEELEALLKDL